MIILEIIFLQHFQPYHKVSYIPHFSPKSITVWEIAAKDDVDIFLKDGDFETLNQTAQVDGPLKRAL